MDIPFSSSVWIPPSSLLYDPTNFSSASSHLLFSQRHVSIYKIVLVPTSLLPLIYYFILLIPNLPFFFYLLYLYCSLLLLFFSFSFFLLLLIFLFLFLFFFLLFFFFLFLPPHFFLLWSLLLFTLFWIPHHLHFSHSPVNLRIVMSKPWHSQNYILLLSSDHIYLYSFSMPLIINIDLYCVFNRSLLIAKNHPHFSCILVFLFFFNLNLCFFANSKLITNPVTLLFSNVSTIAPFWVSILSSPIFTVTSLNIFPLFRLQQSILSTTLESIVNIL